MDSQFVFNGVIALLVAIGGGGAFFKYITDRRKSGAEGKVAEATIELNVDMTRMQNLEERFGLTQKAWDEERASFERRISTLESDLKEEKEGCGERIKTLEQHIGDLTKTVMALTGAKGGPSDEARNS